MIMSTSGGTLTLDVATLAGEPVTLGPVLRLEEPVGGHTHAVEYTDQRGETRRAYFCGADARRVLQSRFDRAERTLQLEARNKSSGSVKARDAAWNALKLHDITESDILRRAQVAAAKK